MQSGNAMSRPPNSHPGTKLPEPQLLAAKQHKDSLALSAGKMDLHNYRQDLLQAGDKSARTSFSSVREKDSELAQAFTSTKVSSYSAEDEEAVEDRPSNPALRMVETQFIPPLTQPQSRLHGCWFPAVAATGFQGWKQIDVKGRLASKSFGDLQNLKIHWSTPPAPKAKRAGQILPGQSPLERLPPELLGPIIELLVLDIPPNGLSARNVDLMSLLLASRTLHGATLNALYKNITIPHSRIFRKFLNHVAENPELGTIVRRLDFSHFNPTSLFQTAAERASTRNLTSETLLRCLNLTPHLREFLAQEYIDDDISADVLRKLFFDLPRLQAVDFCGCGSPAFKDAFLSILPSEWPESLPISRLSLHHCYQIPSSFFESMLPRLGNLTHLDVAGTKITDEALMSIPETANITHLNLAKCRHLTVETVIAFLKHHPAVKNLVFLSLATDARSHQLLDVEDLTELIPILPKTLKSLSLKGSKMDASHIDLLRPLTKHLEELSLGRSLTIANIDRLFVPDERPAEDEGDDMELDWEPHSLKYVDLSDYSGQELDLSALFARDTAMMTRMSAPLGVVEITDELYKRFASKAAFLSREGWTITEFGSRAWLVRLQQQGSDDASGDDGSVRRDSGARNWKMGASYWGMRKVPVANSEVGGMYGNYMFKRRL